MLNHYNILIITEDKTRKKVDITDKIWHLNTNYWSTSTHDYKDEEFLQFINNEPNIIRMFSSDIMKYEINDFLEFVDTNNIIPVILINDLTENGHIIYLAIEERIPDAIEYLINEEDEDLDILLDVIESFMLGKGSILDDNTERTSGKRARRITKA